MIKHHSGWDGCVAILSLFQSEKQSVCPPLSLSAFVIPGIRHPPSLPPSLPPVLAVAVKSFLLFRDLFMFWLWGFGLMGMFACGVSLSSPPLPRRQEWNGAGGGREGALLSTKARYLAVWRRRGAGGRPSFPFCFGQAIQRPCRRPTWPSSLSSSSS